MLVAQLGDAVSKGAIGKFVTEKCFKIVQGAAMTVDLHAAQLRQDSEFYLIRERRNMPAEESLDAVERERIPTW